MTPLRSGFLSLFIGAAGGVLVGGSVHALAAIARVVPQVRVAGAGSDIEPWQVAILLLGAFLGAATLAWRFHQGTMGGIKEAGEGIAAEVKDLAKGLSAIERELAALHVEVKHLLEEGDQTRERVATLERRQEQTAQDLTKGLNGIRLDLAKCQRYPSGGAS